MEKEHAHINGGGCNKLATCLLFYFFHYESGLVLKIIFEKYLFGAPFSPFFSFFIFEHFSPKKWKKNTRTSTVAAVTSLPRVYFHLLFVWKMSIYHIFIFPNCVCTRALHMCCHSYMCKDLAHSSQCTHTPSHARAAQAHLVPLFCRSPTPSSFLSCIGWRHGSHFGLVQRSHRRREAPPGGRRGQGREGHGKRLREIERE